MDEGRQSERGERREKERSAQGEGGTLLRHLRHAGESARARARAQCSPSRLFYLPIISFVRRILIRAAISKPSSPTAPSFFLLAPDVVVSGSPRPTDVTWRGARGGNGHALIALRKHEFPPAKYITKLIAPRRNCRGLAHALRRKCTSSVSSGVRLRARALIYLPTHANRTSQRALSSRYAKKREWFAHPLFFPSSFPLSLSLIFARLLVKEVRSTSRYTRRRMKIERLFQN